MSALPRGRCPVCAAMVAVRTNGKLREHREKVRGKAGPRVCKGSAKATTPETPYEGALRERGL